MGSPFRSTCLLDDHTAATQEPAASEPPVTLWLRAGEEGSSLCIDLTREVIWSGGKVEVPGEIRIGVPYSP